MGQRRMRDGIIQRGSTWSYVIREPDPATGTTRPRWVGGFPSRTAAKKARDAARHATHRGTYVTPQDLTVGQWLDTWIETHAVSLKPSTANSYRGNIERYLKPHLGHERLQALSPSRLSLTFRQLYETGGKDGAPLSPRTVEFARAILRKALDDAVLDRLLEVNPVVGTKRPRAIKPQHKVWTPEQLRAFIAHITTTGDRFAPLWVLAAGTGMRRGELLALRWGDIDLDAGVVSVERSVTQIGRELHYSGPRTTNGARWRSTPTSPPRCGPGARSSRPSSGSGATPTRTRTAWCSRGRTGPRCRATTPPGTSCAPRQGRTCRGSHCTSCATPTPASCWARACRSTSSAPDWATRTPA